MNQCTCPYDPLEGKPILRCEATTKSGCGRYTIHIEPGTITDEAVDFEDVYLVVTQAPLYVTVENATRETGVANPVFNITYDGFKNEETADVLTTKPVASCIADATSQASTYEIIVSGGEADNYELFYNNGWLTVTPSTSFISGRATEETTFNVYTL